jgi:hypothetical protein
MSGGDPCRKFHGEERSNRGTKGVSTSGEAYGNALKAPAIKSLILAAALASLKAQRDTPTRGLIKEFGFTGVSNCHTWYNLQVCAGSE